MTQSKKGSTVVLPSDFQAVRPLLADSQPLTCENPCGRAHALAPSPAQVCEEAEKKLLQAIRLVRSANVTRTYTIAFSGGKDSVLLDYICREAGLHLPKVYNMTTIDPPGTISFCRKHGCLIGRPHSSFLQLVEKKGMPTMFSRYCCQYLKEKYISDFIMTGVRKSESIRRNKRYCSFEAIRKYPKKKSSQILMPLVFFTDNDVDFIIQSRQLECHPLYYDERGCFHVERRLGCMGCPLQGDRGRADFSKYPKLLVSIAKRLIIFHRNHGRTEYDAYINLVYNLFYSNHKKDRFLQTYRGLFSNDPKEFLESYFQIKLP